MACKSLTDLPAELRQRILELIPGSMPDEIQLDQGGWPDPAKQLLATCKLLRADTICLMSKWSFDCLIPGSVYIEQLPRLIRAKEALGLKNRVTKIRLLIFADITMAEVRDAGNITYAYLRPLRRILRKWTERCPQLPTGNIETIVVDVTPLPKHMLERHPNLVPANVAHSRAEVFISEHWGHVAVIMNRLNERFNPAAFEREPVMWRWEAGEDGEDRVVLVEEPPILDPLVLVAVGGQLGESSKPHVFELRNHGGISGRLISNGFPPFVGTYCDGELPTHLSLHRLAQRCGIQLNTSEPATDYILNVSGIPLLQGPWPQQNEVEPGKDFSPLSPLTLSKRSATAYYNNALDDEEAARKVVLKLLAFAVDCRKGVSTWPYVDFLPGLQPRHKLIYELSRDLELVCTSVKGKYGTFDRVSSLAAEVTSRLQDIVIGRS
jgi:hypothetical protein